VWLTGVLRAVALAAVFAAVMLGRIP